MFVTLEGPEGAGKSTVQAALAARLVQAGREVVCTREPGAGAVGEAVREALLHGGEIEPWTELFLYLADRAEHVAKTIRPALGAGKVVLCDRHADSTVVYQGHARGLELALVRRLNEIATRGLRPDLTLLLDLDPVIGLSRTTKGDRLDLEPLEFHQRVRAGFLLEAASEPDRWRTIDASQAPGEVLEACWEAVVASPVFL